MDESIDIGSMDITNLFEFEMYDHEFHLIYVEDTKLYNKILAGFHAMVKNTKDAKLCRYGSYAIACHITNTYCGSVSHGKKTETKQVQEFWNEIGCHQSEKTMEALFSKCVKDRKNVTDDENISMLRIHLKKPEMKELFKKYCPEWTPEIGSNQRCMTIKQLLNFFEIENDDKHTEGSTKKQILQLQNPGIPWGVDYPKLKEGEEVKLSFIDFTSLAFSTMNIMTNQRTLKTSDDMKQPLTNYFIRTSHSTNESLSNSNTKYQFNVDKMLENFLFAMKMGVRCLEIDLYGGPNNEPSLTRIDVDVAFFPLKKLLESLKKWAFKYSS